MTTKRESLFIPASDFFARDGNPTLGPRGANTRYQSWLLGKVSVSVIAAAAQLPLGAVTDTVEATLETVGLCDPHGQYVNWLCVLGKADDGEDINALAGYAYTDMTTLAAAENCRRDVDMAETIEAGSKALIVVEVGRNPLSEPDNLDGSAGLVGVRLTYSVEVD